MTEPTPTLAQLLTDDEPGEVYAKMRIGLPPLTARLQASAVVRDDLPDLSKQTKGLLLIGPGRSGKTTLARWIAETALARGTRNLMLAALDPASRALVDWFPGTMQPKTNGAEDTYRFLRRLLELASQRRHGVWDLGGGDTSLQRLINESSDLENTTRLLGVSLVPVFMLTPRITDLAPLATFAEMGFAPKTTLLVKNLGCADSASDFRALEAQDPYQEAVARGAVEIEMPRLDRVMAKRMEETLLPNENRKPHFTEVATGMTPIANGLDASVVGNWLAEMRAAFAPVETWMPWG